LQLQRAVPHPSRKLDARLWPHEVIEHALGRASIWMLVR
jgi:hypothetical protein